MEFDASFWRKVVDKSLAAIYITDENGKVLYVNDVVERATKYSKEEIYAMESIFELAHPEDRRYLKREFEELGEEGRFYESRYITKDGRVRHVWGFTAKFTFLGKSYIIGNWIDVTKSKELEQALRESEEFYRTLVEDSLTPVYLLQDGIMVYVNKAFEEATGYKREEIVGRNPFFLIHPEDRGLVYKRYIEREKGLRDTMETYSWRIIRKDGEVRWVTARPGRVTYRGRPAVAATVVDTTEIHKLNIELKKKGEYLAFVNKVMRHDIANAITAIRAVLEIVRDSPEEAEKLIPLAIRRSDYVFRLINDARELEKALEELKPVNVAEMVREVAEQFRNVEVSVEAENVVVSANEGLRAVLNNILQNAMVHGGGKARVEVLANERNGIVRVIDYGKGVPDEIKEKIFEEGFTTGEGMGLGLYITKRILEIFGGEIKVRDNEPSGAIFEIKIPKIKEEG
ncbi:sensor histidine kinase [Archaeoglobus fulgidus]|uniref:histidine kinase n=1 Tax=Archaeoglobus fulgidus (strain ATCC 49558 / DSM 4304 / JCM 9628 / NBRC 100126 / VC-16) TaxID=224325 RepID=O29083_ARCFU|nr:PAS domain-containing sensor histidine kinase [Archaeoglobus fulgidus]AAB90059.1 signal-transducing histidine kinase [Archaeoglobus fulgidus DSM 4304]